MIGFNSFFPAVYLEEMLGRFMNVRTKGGAKQELQHKKQGVNTPWSTMTLSSSCIYTPMMRARRTYRSLRD